MRALALSLATALALLAAGCASKSDEDQVKEVMGDYIAAAADGNGEEACKKVTPESKRAFTTQTKISCEKGIEQISKTLTDEQREKAKDLEFEAQVDGDRATAAYDKPAGPGKNIATLQKRDGDWLIASI